MNAPRVLLSSIFVCCLSVSAASQGRTDYCNFEAPAVKPITTVTLNASGTPRRYLLVCNPADNAVEVYALGLIESATDFGFAARIPVGLEPVSVTAYTFADGTVRMYTANWLGDSVTFVRLSASTNAGIADDDAFSYTVERAVDVGDEPTCVAVMGAPAQERLFVTKRSASSYTMLFADTGLSATGAFPDATELTSSGGPFNRVGGGKDVIMSATGVIANPNGMFNRPVGTGIDGQQTLIKEPQTVVVRGARAWVIGQQGGGSKLDHGPFITTGYNLDLWGIDLTTPTLPGGTSLGFVDGSSKPIGTTNFNMDASADGSTLYVVGTDARNDKIGNPALNDAVALPTGFVTTLLYKCSVTSSPIGISSVKIRDLNRIDGSTNAVPKAKSLAHATDVAVYSGAKVCVVAFNSDNFAVVDTSNSDPVQWVTERTAMPANSGPRGVTVATNIAALSNGDRAYVFNRLANSVSSIDLKEPNVAARVKKTFALKRDPMPAYVRAGQKFLYSTQFSSNGFVSCASCHIDGRSDQQQWRLGKNDGQPLDNPVPLAIQGLLQIPTAAHELDPLDTTNSPPEVLTDLTSGDGFPFKDLLSDNALPATGTVTGATHNGKGPMITQSLQGLLNFEVGPDCFELVTNAPYHWRGDKPSFLDFNEAFVNLQGATNLGGTLDAHALTDDEMQDYEEFINSIHYPPNPLEPLKRVHSGDSGSGAKLGENLFHTRPTALLPNADSRSCVQCHSLPEGSNNRLTFLINPIGLEDVNDDPLLYPPFLVNDPAQLKRQPLESAALRGMLQKEARLEFDSTVRALTQTFLTNLRCGDLGMGHEGVNGLSLNQFVQPITTNATTGALGAIIAYVREFDHGVAPMVGKTVCLLKSQVTSTGTIIDSTVDALVTEMESQAKLANSGLAVYARFGAVEHGYWYRVDLTNLKYQETISGTGTTDRTTILQSLFNAADGVVVLTATPIGSERRVASLTGAAAGYGNGLPPTNVSIVATTPNSANLDIPTLTGNLPGTAGGPPAAKYRSLDVLDDLQDELFGTSLGTRFHDAPRRLRLTGTNLRPGAQVRIEFSFPGTPNPITKQVILPVHAVKLSGGNTRWETAVELDPLTLYVLIAGGFADAAVRDHLTNPASTMAFPARPILYKLWAKNTDSSWFLIGNRAIVY